MERLQCSMNGRKTSVPQIQSVITCHPQVAKYRKEQFIEMPVGKGCTGGPLDSVSRQPTVSASRGRWNDDNLWRVKEKFRG